MSKFKLEWRFPRSLNYIAFGIVLVASGVFLQYPVALTWWMSCAYFLLVSALLVIGINALRRDKSTARFVCTSTGGFEFIGPTGERRVYELLPSLSLQSDYFCLLALRPVDDEQSLENRVVSPISVKELIASSRLCCSPQALMNKPNSVGFLLLPADSLSSSCFRHLSRVLRQQFFLHSR